MAMNGYINKCPACGALREAMVAVCPDCGYTFTQINTRVVSDINDSIQSLNATSLTGKEYNKRYIEIIRNFPIPHLKDEILDVMFFIQPKALEKTSNISLAWRSRQREVFERAKVICKEDKKHLSIITRYELELKKASGKKIFNWWHLMSSRSKVLFILTIVFILILIIPAKNTSPEKYAIRFNEAVVDGKVDKALKYINKYPQMGSLITDDYVQLIKQLVDKDRMIEAELLLKNCSSYASTKRKTEVENKIKQIFVKKYLANGDITKAEQYINTRDIESLVFVLKAYIEMSNDDALRFYRKYSNSFVRYDYNLHRRALQTNDPVVIEFLTKNGIKY